jgi:hypothetical protein
LEAPYCEIACCESGGQWRNTHKDDDDDDDDEDDGQQPAASVVRYCGLVKKKRKIGRREANER